MSGPGMPDIQANRELATVKVPLNSAALIRTATSTYEHLLNKGMKPSEIADIGRLLGTMAACDRFHAGRPA